MGVKFHLLCLQLFLFSKHQPAVALQHQSTCTVIVREVEGQMVLEMKAKKKWQVLVSKDGRGWQERVHSTLLSLFSSPHFSSVTVNLQTWIWWWYLVTAAALYSLLWYFLPRWCVRLYAEPTLNCFYLSHFVSLLTRCRVIQQVYIC